MQIRYTIIILVIIFLLSFTMINLGREGNIITPVNKVFHSNLRITVKLTDDYFWFDIYW